MQLSCFLAAPGLPGDTQLNGNRRQNPSSWEAHPSTVEMAQLDFRCTRPILGSDLLGSPCRGKPCYLNRLPMLQIRKFIPREVESLSQICTAKQWKVRMKIWMWLKERNHFAGDFCLIHCVTLSTSSFVFLSPDPSCSHPHSHPYLVPVPMIPTLSTHCCSVSEIVPLNRAHSFR